jgi:hypothetical protein
VPCLWENAGCLRDSIHRELPIRCVQNPDAGFEHEVGGELRRNTNTPMCWGLVVTL